MLNLQKILRASDWYTSKAAGLAGLLFLFSLHLGISFETFVWIAPLSFITLIGIAALGYLLNDLSDRESDKIAGKKNFILDSKKEVVFLTSLIILQFAFLPWIWLPKTRVSYFFLISEIALFFLYSFNPIRLKERRFIGLISDSLYAHVIPSLFAFYTFWLITDKAIDIWFPITLSLWQFFVGLRNIIQHHISDRKKDAISKTYNYFNENPIGSINLVSKKLLIPELIFFLIFCAQIASYWWVYILTFLVFSVNQMFAWRGALVWRIKTKLKFGFVSPSFFYEQRIGLTSGLILSFFNPWFLIFIVAYVVLLRINLKSILWGIKIFFFKTLINPYYKFIMIPWYKHVVKPYHSVFLKNCFYYGHKLKIWLGLYKS